MRKENQKTSHRKRCLAAALVCLAVTSAVAEEAGIPAVAVSVLENARMAAGPHPDAVASEDTMGMRPERRAEAQKPAEPKADWADAAETVVREHKTEQRTPRMSQKDPETAAAHKETLSPANDTKDTVEPARDQKVARSVIIRSPRITVLPGVNVVIPVARSQPNRLVTPFKHPQVLSADLAAGKGDDCGEACVRGSVLYVSTEATKPVTAFITERGREDIAISVTMIPERIAPREVTFLLPKAVMEKLAISDAGGVSGSDREARVWEQSQPYISALKETFKTIALGRVPQGFSLRNVRATDTVPVCRQDGLRFNFRKGQVLEGHNLTVFVGLVRNPSADPVEFNETGCGAWNVAAVTSFPLKVLDTNETTEVYVAVKKERRPAASSVRRSLTAPGR